MNKPVLVGLLALVMLVATVTTALAYEGTGFDNPRSNNVVNSTVTRIACTLNITTLNANVTNITIAIASESGSTVASSILSYNATNQSTAGESASVENGTMGANATYRWDTTKFNDSSKYKITCNAYGQNQVSASTLLGSVSVTGIVINNTVPVCTWISPSKSAQQIDYDGGKFNPKISAANASDVFITVNNKIFTAKLTDDKSGSEYFVANITDGDVPEGMYDFTAFVADKWNATTGYDKVDCALLKNVYLDVPTSTMKARVIAEEEDVEASQGTQTATLIKYAAIAGAIYLLWKLYLKKK